MVPRRIVDIALSIAIAMLIIGCRAEPPWNAAQPRVMTGHAIPTSGGIANGITPPSDSAHEDLDATLWLRTSAEYQTLTTMIYRSATDRLQQALHDPTWSAVLNSPTDSSDLPPAVILDVDETVLDNSGYQVLLIQRNHEFDKGEWHEFVELRESTAIPGVKEFLDTCRELGIAVFFVTNRDARVEAATMENLLALDLLLPDEGNEHLLMKYERESWTSDKTNRREFLAASYRVLLLLGDDLNDFVAVGEFPTAKSRRDLAVQHAPRWGTQWFLLPNPNYGGWERSIYAFDDALPRSQKLERKKSALEETRD